MAEKIKFESEAMSGKTPEEIGFSLMKERAPYALIEAAALELARHALYSDDVGCCYETYHILLEKHYVVLKYFSNIDVDEADKRDLYDFFSPAVSDAYWLEDINWRRVDELYQHMFLIIEKRYNRENSLDYKVGLLADALRTQADKDASEMGEKLIDLMDKVKEADAKANVSDLTVFAKREPGSL